MQRNYFNSNNLHFLQINLQHKKTATDLLMQNIIQSNIDIALVQEPYINRNGKIPSVPRGYTAFNASSVDARSAIIIKSSFVHFPRTDFFSEDVVIVDIMIENKAVTFCSVYCKLSEQPVPELLKKAVQSIRNEFIISVDTNCHSTLVGYGRSDLRANDWEKFLIDNFFSLHNESNMRTFKNSRGHTSTIDWTISSSQLQIERWTVRSDEPSLSDHQYISFQLALNSSDGIARLRNYKKADWEKIKRKIRNISGLQLWSTIEEAAQLNEAVEFLEEKISKAIDENVPSVPKICHKNLWWNEDLQHMKSRLKRARRKRESNVMNLQAEFDQAIREAKEKSWRKFLEEMRSVSDGFLRYKILCKTHSGVGIGPVRRPDGNMTESIDESAEVLLNHHFPPLVLNRTDDEKLVEEELISIRGKTCNVEPLITVEEIRSVLRELRHKKAPGPDTIPSSLLINCQEEADSNSTPYFQRFSTLGKISGQMEKSQGYLYPKARVKCNGHKTQESPAN